ncbi:unnamed protein product [Symbiodinium sp. CCMP2592]|nr:unnamed protein product [Symbiodinium sp. CCMP2592]
MDRPSKFRRCGTALAESEPGPKTVGELCEWPREDISDRLIAKTGISAKNLVGDFAGADRTIWVTSSFSGIATVEHCLTRLAAQHGTADFGEPKSTFPPFCFYSMWEVNETCRKTVANSKLQPMHIFGSVCDKCSVDVQDRLEFVRSSWCQRQQEGMPAEQKRQAAWKQECDGKCMSKLLSVGTGACGIGKRSKTAYCYRHKRQCLVDPPVTHRDLHFEIAGTPCVAFSPQGGRSGWLHETSIPTSIWFAATSKSNVDLVFHECSHMFPSEGAFGMAFSAGGGFEFSVVKVMASTVGIPMQRPRKFTLAWRKEALQSRAQLTEDLFAGVCGSSVQCSSHDFWCAPQEKVQAALIAQAKKHGADWSLASLGRDALSTGDRVRLSGYETAARDQEGSQDQLAVVDLSQNVAWRPKLGSGLPSILCGSRVWSMQHERVLISEELFVLMGWPVPGMGIGMKDDGSFPFQDDIFLKDGAAKKMTGNAMQCRLVGLFLALAFHILEPKDADAT